MLKKERKQELSEIGPISINDGLLTREHLERDGQVISLFFRGFTKELIAEKTELEPDMIESIILAYKLKETVEARNREIKEKILLEKVPVLKQIVSRSLNAVKDWLEELSNDEVRHERLRSVSDVKNLASIATGLNEMLRLELGQSTHNISHDVKLSLDQTKKVFKDLIQVDEVFDYPQLEEIEAEIIEQEAK